MDQRSIWLSNAFIAASRKTDVPHHSNAEGALGHALAEKYKRKGMVYELITRKEVE